MEALTGTLFSPTFAFISHMSHIYGTSLVSDVAGLELNKKQADNTNKSFDTFIKNREKAHKSFKEILGEETIQAKERRDVKNMNVNRCNHNPNDANTSLQKTNKRIMVQPISYFYICPCCNQGFRFKKENDGTLTKIEDRI